MTVALWLRGLFFQVNVRWVVRHFLCSRLLPEKELSDTGSKCPAALSSFSNTQFKVWITSWWYSCLWCGLKSDFVTWKTFILQDHVGASCQRAMLSSLSQWTEKLHRCVVLSFLCTNIVPLDMKGCICHFVRWQIHPFISNGTNYSGLDNQTRFTACNNF